MSTLLIILWAFVPAWAWLYYIYRKDRYEREPFKQILKVYLVGMLITIPAGFINHYAGSLFPGAQRTLADTAGLVFLVVGPNEELWKFLAVYILMYKHGEFDEPMDGLVYACTAALGFAGLENVLYAFQHGANIVWLRAFTAVPGHFLDAAIYGYVLGMKKFNHKTIPVALAVIIAAAVHGLYDFFAFGAALLNPFLMLGLLVLVLVCQAIWFRGAVKRLLAVSPFRFGDQNQGINCAGCQR